MPPALSAYYANRAHAGTFENQILYRMCLENPLHEDDYVTEGKIIAIGRIYAASPQRGNGKTPENGQALSKSIAEHIRGSRLDEDLKAISPDATIVNPKTLHQVKDAHATFVTTIAEATKVWQKKDDWKPLRQISFASKYLHFHRPNAFPIIDTFARKGLNCAGFKGVLSDYEKFCDVFLAHAKEKDEDWTPRSIDTQLVNNGRLHGARTQAKACKICCCHKALPRNRTAPAGP